MGAAACYIRVCSHLLLLAAMSLSLSGCRKAEAPAVQDCGEDFGCLVLRAQGCKPARALLRQEYTIEGRPVRGLARYELVGRVRGQCHVRRTQLEPPPGTFSRPKETWKYKLRRYEDIPPTPKLRPGELPLPLMQCLYPESQVAGVLRRLQQGTSTQEDLDFCYPGEGGCDEVPTPVLGPGCVLDDCLLGRWTFVCEYMQGNKLAVHECIGTRLSDESPGCFLLCREGRHDLDCRKPGDLPLEQELPPDPPAFLFKKQ